ncbi:hypothetical protein FQA39_LY14503 [Lamprigera yunnana]|nr:hypothetical protein FQA39_LY14503 [Lamprigera yunnana]
MKTLSALKGLTLRDQVRSLSSIREEFKVQGVVRFTRNPRTYKMTKKNKKSLPTCVCKRPPDLLTKFRTEDIINIPATSEPKPDPFEEMRPPPKTVLDYTISETYMKLRKSIKNSGVAQVHLKETVADYICLPPGYVFPEDVPPPRPPKVSHFSGGPPVWEFEHEKQNRIIERKQKKYREKFKHFKKENKKFEKREEKERLCKNLF